MFLLNSYFVDDGVIWCLVYPDVFGVTTVGFNLDYDLAIGWDVDRDWAAN